MDFILCSSEFYFKYLNKVNDIERYFVISPVIPRTSVIFPDDDASLRYSF